MVSNTGMIATLAGKIRYLRPGAFLPDIVTSNALAQSLRFWFARFRSRALLILNGYFRPMAASSHCTFHSSRLNPGTARFRTLQNISILYKLTNYILSFAVTKINTATISTTPQSNVRIKCRMLQNVFIIVCITSIVHWLECLETIRLKILFSLYNALCRHVFKAPILIFDILDIDSLHKVIYSATKLFFNSQFYHILITKRACSVSLSTRLICF